MSDGKLNYDTRIGNNLGEIISPEKNTRLTEEVEGIFRGYGISTIENNVERISALERTALQKGIDFLGVRHAHVGSEKLRDLMIQMREDLISNGVKISTKTEIRSPRDLKYDSLILATGRSGSEDMERFLEKEGIKYSYRPVDIGVRIEVPRRITDDITDFSRDMKFYILTKGGQRVRTFCACPGGFVDTEMHEEFGVVNGQAYAEKSSQNTNFALLTTVGLTEPTSNTNKHAKDIARTFNTLSNGRGVISQRLGDIREGRRSKEKQQQIYHLHTTLSDPVWGDIGKGMPFQEMKSLLEAIEKLDEVIPGIASNQSIWHGAEIKMHGLQIKTNKTLRAKERIWVAGDGSGFTRGIVGAAASGLLAAEGIKSQ